MSMAQVVISGIKSGLSSGSDTIGPLSIVNTNTGDEKRDLALTTGANTITVPGTNYIGAILIPPTTNTASLTLKGVTGDTGVALNVANPSLLSIPAGTVNFVLTVGGNVTITLIWF